MQSDFLTHINFSVYIYILYIYIYIYIYIYYIKFDHVFLKEQYQSTHIYIHTYCFGYHLKNLSQGQCELINTVLSEKHDQIL